MPQRPVAGWVEAGEFFVDVDGDRAEQLNGFAAGW